jgi:hypothetical protein
LGRKPTSYGRDRFFPALFDPSYVTKTSSKRVEERLKRSVCSLAQDAVNNLISPISTAPLSKLAIDRMMLYLFRALGVHIPKESHNENQTQDPFTPQGEKSTDIHASLDTKCSA